MHMIKRGWLEFQSRGIVVGAGVAISGVGQAASDDTLQTLITALVLAACLLPILMAIFGAFVMRFLGWFTRAQETQEDEVVYPEPTLPEGVHLPEPTIWPAVLAFGLMGLMFAVAFDSWLKWVALGLGGLMVLLGLGGWIVVEVKEFRLRGR